MATPFFKAVKYMHNASLYRGKYQYTLAKFVIPEMPKYNNYFPDSLTSIKKKTIKNFENYFFFGIHLVFYEKEKLYVGKGIVMDENFNVLMCWVVPKNIPEIYRYENRITVSDRYFDRCFRPRVFEVFVLNDFAIFYSKIFNLLLHYINEIELKVNILPEKEFKKKLYGNQYQQN